MKFISLASWAESGESHITAVFHCIPSWLQVSSKNMPEERGITSPVASNVKNPPWGTEPQTPGTGLYKISTGFTHETFISELSARLSNASAGMTTVCVIASVRINPSNYIDCLLIYIYSVWNKKEAVSMDDLCQRLCWRYWFTSVSTKVKYTALGYRWINEQALSVTWNVTLK